MEDDWVATWIEVGDAEIDGDDPMAVIDPLWWTVNFYETPEVYAETSKKFSLPQRRAYAMKWFDCEVCNGGLDQFFYNSTGMVWRDALDGFEEAGLLDAAALLEEAVRRLGGPPPLDRDARMDLLDSSDAGFDDLDDAYFALPPLDPQMMAYIRRNSQVFHFKGWVRMPPPREAK